MDCNNFLIFFNIFQRSKCSICLLFGKQPNNSCSFNYFIYDYRLAKGVEQAAIDKFFGELTTLIHHNSVKEDDINIYNMIEAMGYDADKLMEEVRHF